MVSNISNNINNTNLSLDVYPNPTNANTTISFTLDQPSKVSINVHDVLGRSVYANNSNFYKGNHLVTFTLEDYESGIYFINTNINNQSFSNKLILNK